MSDILLHRRRMMAGLVRTLKNNEIWYKTTDHSRLGVTIASNNTLNQEISYNGYYIQQYENTVTSVVSLSSKTKLAELLLPDMITVFPSSFLLSTTNLTVLRMPSELVTINASAFRFSVLPQIILPSKVKTIGSGAFEQSNASIIELPEGVETITSGFPRSKVLSLDLPSSIKSLGPSELCNGNTSIKTVTIRCDGTTGVIFPNNAFNGCTALESVVFSGRLFSDFGGNAFAGCTKLTHVVLPESVSMIRDGVFKGCGSLEEITFPAAFTYFYNASGIANCFTGCSNLKRVYIKNQTRKIYSSAGTVLYGLVGLPYNTDRDNYPQPTVYVPNSLLASYQSDSKWNIYNLVGFNPT